jgi:hypothetical protein
MSKKDSTPIMSAALGNNTLPTSGTINSIGIEVNQLYAWSIQAEWTGTPTGAFTIQVSNDILPLAPSTSNPVGPNPAANVVNWSTYTGSAVVTSGSSGNWMWISQLGPYKWVRLSYTGTSGTGTVTANFFAKG